MSEEQSANIEEKEIPLKVEITNQPKIEEINPTSIDTVDEYDIQMTDEEIKEAQDLIDAQ